MRIYFATLVMFYVVNFSQVDIKPQNIEKHFTPNIQALCFVFESGRGDLNHILMTNFLKKKHEKKNLIYVVCFSHLLHIFADIID